MYLRTFADNLKIAPLGVFRLLAGKRGFEIDMASEYGMERSMLERSAIEHIRFQKSTKICRVYLILCTQQNVVGTFSSFTFCRFGNIFADPGIRLTPKGLNAMGRCEIIGE